CTVRRPLSSTPFPYTTLFRSYWGVMLWNSFMQTYDYRYERIGINKQQATYEPDGSWRLVIAARDPGHPNWLSTAGHRHGILFFRDRKSTRLNSSHLGISYAVF